MHAKVISLHSFFCRIVIHLPKCNPHIKRRSQMIDSSDSAHTIHDLVIEHVNNFVDIRWKIVSLHFNLHSLSFVKQYKLCILVVTLLIEILLWQKHEKHPKPWKKTKDLLALPLFSRFSSWVKSISPPQVLRNSFGLLFAQLRRMQDDLFQYVLVF